MPQWFVAFIFSHSLLWLLIYDNNCDNDDGNNNNLDFDRDTDKNNDNCHCHTLT